MPSNPVKPKDDQAIKALTMLATGSPKDFDKVKAVVEVLIRGGSVLNIPRYVGCGMGCDEPPVLKRARDSANVEKQYIAETLLSNALAAALRERGFEAVWNSETKSLKVIQIEEGV